MAEKTIDVRTLDEESRCKIVSDIDTNYFVEAGAGSGKTTILVNRMVAMVEKGIPVNEISAITFTKAAANEFYARFQKKLIERSKQIELVEEKHPGDLRDPNDTTRNYCKEAIKNIDLCFMGTIDAFCNMILSEHPSEAKIPSDAIVVDDEALEELYRNEFKNIYNGIYGKKLKDECLEFIEFNYDSEDVFVESLKTIMNRRNATLQLPKKARNEDSKLINDLKDKTLRIVKKLSQLEEEERYYGNEKSRKAWESINRCQNKLNKDWLININDVINSLKDLAEICVSKNVNLENAFKLDADEFEVKTKSSNLTKCFTDILESVETVKYNFSIRFINDSISVVADSLKAKGNLTFFDYLLYLKEMLKEDAKNEGKLIKHIQERHKYFLIDEFQDTDPMQAEVFFYLTSKKPCENWRECIPNKGSLFIVGDPKQSIYRFRNADVSAFLNIKSMFKNEVGEVLYLAKNFRSTAIISGWFNKAFTDLLPSDTNEQSKYQEIPLNEQKDEGLFGGVYYYESYRNAKNVEKTLVDSYKVGDIIEKLVDNPNYKIKDKNDVKPRMITYKDFMIITPKKKNLKDYTLEFSKRKIPYFVEGKIDFKDSEILTRLYSMFVLLAKPYDNRYLFAALKNYYNYSDGDLTALANDGYDFKVFDSKYTNDPKILAISEEIKNKIKITKQMSPSTLFAYLIEDINIVDINSSNLEYVYYVLENLKSEEKQGSIASLLEASLYLEKLLHEQIEKERCLSLKQDNNKVHIANLHKVKGLEAPIVILAAPSIKVNKEPNIRIEIDEKESKCYIFKISKSKEGNKVSNITYLTNYGNEIEKQKEKQSLDNEITRLLYVAATRARNVLIIAKCVNETTKNIGRWNPLLNYVDKDINKWIEDYNHKKDYKEFNIKEGYIKAEKENKELLANDVNNKTYTIIRPSKIKIRALENDFIEEHNELDYVNISATNSALRGTLIHRLMELLVISKGNVVVENLVNQVLNELATDYRINIDDYKEELTNIASTIIVDGYKQESSVPQNILKELIEADEVYLEVPFCYKDKDELRHGYMDVVYLKNKKWHIIDYKTNKNASGLDKHYKDQLDSYVEAFKKITGNDADAFIYHIG